LNYCDLFVTSFAFIVLSEQGRHQTEMKILSRFSYCELPMRPVRVMLASCPENVDKEDKRNNRSMISFNGATGKRW